MKFDHIAIKVNNINETVDWYRENLEANILYQDETWALAKVSNIKVAFVLEDQHPPHLCFEIGKDKKEELKISHSEFKYHRDGSEYIYIKDNNDNTIEFLYWPEVKNVN